MEKLVVIIPTLNESENIGEMIEIIENEVFQKIFDLEPYILIVDDTSTDGTIEIVEEKMKRYRNLYIAIDSKKGLGVAYKRGVNIAINELEADVIIKMDADFQHDPRYIIKMLNKYRQGYDYVIGSRYCEGGSIPKGWSLFRKIISKYGGLYTRIILFFPNYDVVKDVSSGFALGSVRNVLNKIDYSILTSEFYYSQQLLYQVVKMGKKIAEVPIKFNVRTKNYTKMPISNIWGTFINMPLLRIKMKLKYMKM